LPPGVDSVAGNTGVMSNSDLMSTSQRVNSVGDGLNEDLDLDEESNMGLIDEISNQA
jgi:hypothetical protein